MNTGWDQVAQGSTSKAGARRENSIPIPASRPSGHNSLIASGHRFHALAFWIIGLLALATTPVMWQSAMKAIHGGNRMGVLGMLFPVLGVGMIVAAILFTARAWKFGTSKLELINPPGAIGGYLAGRVHIPARLDFIGAVSVSLNCIRQLESHSGGDRRIDYITTRQDAQELVSLPRTPPGESIVPIFFNIPESCSPSDDSVRGAKLFWRLDVHAQVTGADYVASFVVPVVKPTDLQSQPQIEDLAASYRRKQQSPRTPPPGVRISPAVAGKRTFEFAAMMQPRVALSFVLVGGLLIAAALFLTYTSAPALLRIPLVLFSLLMLWLITIVTIRKSTIQITRDHVEIRKTYLGLGRRVILPLEQINNIRAVVRISNNRTAYHAIEFQTARGKISAGGLIQGRADADWVADLMLEAIADNRS